MFARQRHHLDGEDECRDALSTLNSDVLLHIVTFLARSDLSSFMKTSHEYYDLGLAQLFRNPIELRADNILSFHTYLRLGTSPARSSFLRHAVINCSLSRPSRPRNHNGELPSIEQLLSDVLRGACNLKRLRLDWGAASSSEYLRFAASALNSLEEIEAPFVSQALWDNICNLAAPLRRLTARFGPMHRFPAADPVVLLEPFWSTLEQLDLSVIHCEDESVQYPRVQSLTLSDCYHGMLRGGIDIGPVVRAFPKVEKFTLSAAKVHPEASHWWNGRCCDHADVIERCRSLNQQHWRREQGADDAAWQSLTHVAVGHVIDLYMLGLCRSVPHVEIQALSEDTLWMLPRVLADSRPYNLAISVFARDYVLDSLPRLFSPADAATLTRFSLDFRCDVPEVDVDKMVANVTALLAPLRVEDLSIRLSRWDTAGAYRLSQDGLCAIDDALGRIGDNVGEVASRILDHIPSVKTLTMDIGRREACTMRKLHVPSHTSHQLGSQREQWKHRRGEPIDV